MADPQTYGKREDGTPKGLGYFGEIPTPDGRVATELSFDFDAGGKKIFAPLLVPTLTADEVKALASGAKPSEAIYRKAQDFALQRIRSGKSPFAGTGEQQPLPTGGPGETAQQRLTRALIAADKAGDMEAARALAAALKRAKSDPASDIPGLPMAGAPAPDPTLGQKIVGAGEAALSTATGMTGGLIGLVGGAFKGIADQILKGDFTSKEAGEAVEAAASRGAQALTYAPRTESGQEQAAAVGDFIRAVGPGPLGGSGAAVMAAARPAASAVRAQAGEAVRGAQDAVRTVVQPTPGTQGSVGAAGVDAATLRRAKADELPIPMGRDLTEGQATRTFEAQRFERETAKNPELGAPIRERFADQNRKLVQNMEAFFDASGAEAPDLRSIGASVDKAVRSRAAKDKAAYRVAYKEAEKSGEMLEPVDISSVADYLNANRAGRSSAPILDTAAQQIKVQEIGGGNLADGSVSVGTVTLKQAEDLRKAINKFTKSTDPNDIGVASDLKGLIDAATDGRGGELYRRARRLRSQYSRDYEDIALIRNLIGQKRGTTDRAIALEDVLNRSILEPSTSLDSVRQVRKILQTEGDNGKQAWRDLQGGVLRHIRDEATKNVARNERGDPIVSAAQLDRVIQQLDKNGKLDFVFGKRGAETLRTINDVAKDVLTVVPGSVNTSNTASVILAAMDIAISGTAGVPAPVLSSLRLAAKGVKNAKTRAAVKRALGE